MTVFRIARALVAFICGWSLFINKVLASHVFGLSMLHRKKTRSAFYAHIAGNYTRLHLIHKSGWSHTNLL